MFILYYLHRNIWRRYRWYPQIMDWFHDIYVSDHLMILSKCLFIFEVGRKWKRWCVINFFHNFFKIKLLMLFDRFPPPQCNFISTVCERTSKQINFCLNEDSPKVSELCTQIRCERPMVHVWHACSHSSRTISIWSYGTTQYHTY